MTNEHEAKTSETTKPVAVLLMGGPAAGKTTTREKMFAGFWIVDSDAFKEIDPEYDPKAVTVAVHERSSERANRALFAALGSGEDFVYDSTGTNAERMVSILNTAKSAGYQTKLVYVACSLPTALARNAARPRTVPESIVREKHATVDIAFNLVKPYADDVVVVNTEDNQ